MRFAIIKLILWLKNGKKREIVFEVNKVNIITGDSSTGKTAILKIFDYCFFGNKSKIPESIINENILWYGLLLSINNKTYTLARKSPTKNKVSTHYYFSSTGEIPKTPQKNITGSALKSLFETEFSINSSVTVAYGGNTIRSGAKISLRYFFIFNTISSNIISKETTVFFDKQDETRYKEALPRIFDLALGIETVENILRKEEKTSLEKKITKIKKKQSLHSQKTSDFEKEKIELIKQAKEYSLIDSSLNIQKSMEALTNLIKGIATNNQKLSDRDKLQKEAYLIERKIKNLTRFTKEYSAYKKKLKEISTSLEPINFLMEKDREIIKTSIFDDVYQALKTDLLKIKQAHKKKTPIDNQVDDMIKKLTSELIEVQKKLSHLPKQNKIFENDKEKYFFLGQVKTKIDLYLASNNIFTEDLERQIEKLTEKLEFLKIEDTDAKRELSIKVIEEVILSYIKIANEALDNYSSYLPVFNYTNKALFLRKPKTTYIEPIGSSSNYLFLHLFFSLSMHEVAFQHNSPYIAPFLIIDQPSGPYFDSDPNKQNKKSQKEKDSDIFKITRALELLDTFTKKRIEEGGEFQMIVLEHIPDKIFENMDHIHLVEVFKDGNALIPSDML